MKKLTKLAATLAALVLALALVGCDNESTTEENGQADWNGFTMVDSVDKLDFKVGTYEMKEAASREYKGETLLTGTNIYAVKILSTESVTITQKSTVEKYNDDAYYASEKEDWEEYCTKKGYTCTCNDSTRTITITYPDEPRSQSLSDFKKDWISPESDDNETYSDIKLGSNKNGVIQASYNMNHTWTESDGSVGSNTTHITITLTPKK
ncbi:MAG: hypothetical protein K2J14_03690 [Treponemataceae bacterium]|nr:hypothetical protein [Treponemataceae bacterium]